MAKVGKRLKEIYANLHPEPCALEQALGAIKDSARAKFDETIEVAINLNVDVRHADQQVRGFVVLPHGTGKEARVVVFARGEKAREAQENGADYVGAEDLLEKIQAGFLDFDVCAATPDMMGMVGRLGKILGPRGLMPNPKLGTVSLNIGHVVRDLKKGQVMYKADKGGIVHGRIGKSSFSLEALQENFVSLLRSVVALKPASIKGALIKNISASSTMGPGIKIVIEDCLARLRN